jgi:hypothetical protein
LKDQLQEITGPFAESKQLGAIKEEIAAIVMEQQDDSDIKTKLEK